MTLLQRIEVLFDVERGNHQTIHSGGMIPLMIKKGPPVLDDPLDMHLAHEVQTTLVGLTLWKLLIESFADITEGCALACPSW